ncbi:hypothetical protein QNI16_20725 [Cytophagaceae bacterium YF14B1]|uniref:Uncharacterized protein n=1 Tax=Xanthocytophaga flava TaxID=3048013 RepID=A0AAE3U7H3_9BACT|nr:hypothetical protein [Xanthocytophaga flavus]MDJ1482939.1 hypothetical protein [Xanthocytophaga flavus]
MVRRNIDFCKYLAALSVLFWNFSCRNAKIQGVYCGDRRKIVYANLILKEKQEYTWQLIANGFDGKNYMSLQTGRYIIKGKDILLIGYKEGTKIDSLFTRSIPDTSYGMFKGRKLMIFNKVELATNEILKKSLSRKTEF